MAAMDQTDASQRIARSRRRLGPAPWRGASVPVVPIVALALCWPLVLGGPSYPLHLCEVGSSEETLPLLGLYAGELMVACALVAALRERLSALSLRRLLVVAAVCATLAALGLHGLSLSHPWFEVLAAGAMGVLAFASVALFTLWTDALWRADARRSLAWTACSFVLFIGVELGETLLQIKLAPPTVVASLLLVGCALWLEPVPCAVDARPRPPSGGGGFSLVLAVMACACVGVGLVGDALYAGGLSPVEEGLGLRRVVLRLGQIAVFGPVALALVRGARPGVVLGCAFMALVVCMMAELLCAPILLQMGSLDADLPGVMIMTNFQVFLWFVLCYRTPGKPLLAPLYVGCILGLPRALMVAIQAQGVGFVPGSAPSFALAAMVVWALVVASMGLAGALMVHREHLYSERLEVHRSLVVQPLGPDVQTVAEKPCAPVVSVGVVSVEADLAEDAGVPLLLDEPEGASFAVSADEPSRQEDSAAAASFAAIYGLSRREEEVFELARRGYTARRIAETLYVSESTAQTHIRRIYAKVGVHSKQELIEVLEQSTAL